MELCRQCLSKNCIHIKELWITLDQLEIQENDYQKNRTSDSCDRDSGIGDDSPPQTPNDEGK